MTEVAAEAPAAGFRLVLDNFEGPFDLLLQLIARHKLDITEVALSRVTDEFIATMQAARAGWDLEETSSFLVVAATLLDLKTARLLPSGEIDNDEDLALLEARDLLFARLLQYRAFKQVAAWLSARWDEAQRIHFRPGGVEEPYASLLPELTIPGGAPRLARLAERILSAPEAEVVPVEHLHIPTVSVTEQARLIQARLRSGGAATFRALTADANRLTTVVRFLAILELYRQGVVAFEQLTPLGELTIRWSGEDGLEVQVEDEYDDALPVDDSSDDVGSVQPLDDSSDGPGDSPDENNPAQDEVPA